MTADPDKMVFRGINEIFMALKPVADAINEACNEIEKEDKDDHNNGTA